MRYAFAPIATFHASEIRPNGPRAAARTWKLPVVLWSFNALVASYRRVNSRAELNCVSGDASVRKAKSKKGKLIRAKVQR
jgi:hypothetical protein